MPSADPLKRLREIREQEELLEAQWIVLRKGRDPLIKSAAAAGYSQQKIAGATGLTRARIGQILDE